MKYKINSMGTIILADEEFMNAVHPGDFTLIVEAVQPTKPPRCRIVTGGFLQRFTKAERKAIKVLAKTNTDVDDYWSLVTSGPFVNLNDTNVIQPMTLALETLGPLAVGRSVAILNTSLTDDETP